MVSSRGGAAAAVSGWECRRRIGRRRHLLGAV